MRDDDLLDGAPVPLVPWSTDSGAWSDSRVVRSHPVPSKTSRRSCAPGGSAGTETGRRGRLTIDAEAIEQICPERCAERFGRRASRRGSGRGERGVDPLGQPHRSSNHMLGDLVRRGDRLVTEAAEDDGAIPPVLEAVR